MPPKRSSKSRTSAPSAAPESVRPSATTTVAKREPREPRQMAVGPFGPRIAVQYRTKQRHLSPYLPDGDLSIAVFGSRGTGKSTWILSILGSIANLGQILICSKVSIAVNDAYQAIEQYCEDNDIDFDIFTDYTTARAGIEEAIERKEEGKDGLIIMDDFSNAKSGNNDPYNSCMNQVAQILRNYGYHIICVTQAPQGLPTLTRNNTNIKVLFELKDHNALRIIAEDFVMSDCIPGNTDRERKAKFRRLYNQLREAPHSFLMLVSKGGENHIYRYINGKEVPDVPHEYDPTMDTHLSAEEVTSLRQMDEVKRFMRQRTQWNRWLTEMAKKSGTTVQELMRAFAADSPAEETFEEPSDVEDT